jgi:hypothetical protein
MNKRIGAFCCLVQSNPVYCNLGIIVGILLVLRSILNYGTNKKALKCR